MNKLILSFICFILFFGIVIQSFKLDNVNYQHKKQSKSLTMKQSLHITSSSDGSSNYAKSIKCKDGSECPALNTCCLISDGSYACCPTPNGVCCNNNHCCTQGFHCGSGGNICIPGRQRALRF